MDRSFVTPLIEEILNEAKKLVASPVIQPISFFGYQSYQTKGDRLVFEEEYFNRRKQLDTLALAALLEPKAEYLSLLSEVIWQICNEFTWALPPHLNHPDGFFHRTDQQMIDLFAAETAQSLAEITQLLADQLPQQILLRVKEEIEYRVIDPLFDQVWDWETMENNWSAVIAGSIGMTALDLYVGDHQRQLKIIDRLTTAFNSYFKGFPSDGACLEGVGYWIYGFGYYNYFAEKYYQLFADKKYLQHPLAQKIAAFPYWAQLGGNHYLPFSDASTPQMASGLLTFCHDYYRVPIPEFSQVSPFDFENCYRWAHIYRNLIWSHKVESTHTLDQSMHYFPATQWLVIKDQTADFCFAATANDNQDCYAGERTGHNHNDIGNFIVGDGTELLLTDLGAGEYNRAYFDPTLRYTILNNRSLGHSVPYINHEEQAEGDYFSRNVVCEEAADRIKFTMELTDAYPKSAQLRSFERSFTIEPALRQVTLTDRMEFYDEQATEVVEGFISLRDPVVTEGQVIWLGEKNRLVLAFDPQVDEVTVIAEEITDHLGVKQAVFRTQIAAKEHQQAYQREFCFRLQKYESMDRNKLIIKENHKDVF